MEEKKLSTEETAVEQETKKAPLNASVAPENFDWEAFESEASYGTDSKEKISQAYEQTLSKIVENERRCYRCT